MALWNDPNCAVGAAKLMFFLNIIKKEPFFYEKEPFILQFHKKTLTLWRK